MSLPLPNLAALRQFAAPSSPTSSSSSSGEEIKSNGSESEDSANTTSSSNESSKTVTQLEAMAISCVLNNTTDFIKLLDSFGDQQPVKCDLNYKTLEEQFSSKGQQTYIFDPETLEPYATSIKTQMVLKLHRDLHFFVAVIKEAQEELITNLDAKAFLKRLASFRRTEAELGQLLTDAKENKKKVKLLSDMMETDKIRLNDQLLKKSKELGKLRDQYEDAIYENQIKTVYIDHWEKARTYQNEKLLRDKEESLQNAIRTYDNDYKREARINMEIEEFETMLQQTYTADTEMWMEKHARQLEEKGVEISKMKEKREQQMKKLENLSAIYELHKKEIEDYLVLREQRRVEAAELERLDAMATKIQAWWRGVMYRKCLGPYRKKKGKGKKKGSDKPGSKENMK